MQTRTNVDEGPTEALLRILFHLRAAPVHNPDDMRSRILATAIPMFAGRGYAGTSMRDVAAGVQIKAASLYAHFPEGKQQLLRDGLREIFDEFLAYIVSPLASDMTTDHQLSLVIRQHVRWQLDNAPKALAWDAALAQFGVEGALTPEFETELRERRALYHEYVECLLASLQTRPDADQRAIAVLTLCDAARVWHVSGGGRLATPDDVASFLWDLTRDLVADRSPTTASSASRVDTPDVKPNNR